MNQYRLFCINNDGISRQTHDADDIDIEVRTVLQPVIDKWLAANFDVRDLEYLIQQQVVDLFTMTRLQQEIDFRRQQKLSKETT